MLGSLNVHFLTRPSKIPRCSNHILARAGAQLADAKAEDSYAGFFKAEEAGSGPYLAGIRRFALVFIARLYLAGVHQAVRHGRKEVVRAPDGRGVVLKANDRVVGVGFQGRFHDLHQRLGRGLAIQDELGAKKPMPAA